MPTIGDIHQDHQTIAAEGLRAFKRTTILGYEIPWNQFSFAKQAYVVLEELHLEAKVRGTGVLPVAAAPQLRERGVHPQPRAHAWHRDRPAVRRVLRSRAVGRVTARPLRVLLTASGAPGAARLIRALQENGERKLAVIGTDMSERSAGRFLCDSFHVVPPGSSDEFAPAVAALAEREGADVVFPQSSGES